MKKIYVENMTGDEWKNANDKEKKKYFKKRLKIFEKETMGLAKIATELSVPDLFLYKRCETKIAETIPHPQYLDLENILNQEIVDLFTSKGKYHEANVMHQYILVSKAIICCQKNRFEKAFDLFFTSLRHNKNLLALVSYALEEYKSELPDYAEKKAGLKSLARGLILANAAIAATGASGD